jgi:hypothetical protein
MSDRGTMHVSELLEDADRDTAVDAISGVRRKSSTGIALADLAEDLIARLTLRDGTAINEFARRLLHEPTNGGPGLIDCRDSFRSWAKAPPNGEVREKYLTQYTTISRVAQDYLFGSSSYRYVAKEDQS